MKIKLSLVVVGLLSLVGLQLVSSAHAADVYKGVTSYVTDGGTAPIAFAIAAKTDWLIRCADPQCYKVGGASVTAPNCAQDYLMQQSISGGKYERAFSSASASYVIVKQADGGTQTCNVYQVTGNPTF